jgi:hypothetical protein
MLKRSGYTLAILRKASTGAGRLPRDPHAETAGIVLAFARSIERAITASDAGVGLFAVVIGKKKARHNGRAQEFKSIALPRLRPIPVVNLLLGLILG